MTSLSQPQPIDETESQSEIRKKSDDRPIAIDIFSGAGGMSLGFQQAGFNVVAAVDNDPLNTEIHHANFPHSVGITSDISKLSGKELRSRANIGEKEIAVLFGGPPCQGFSFIGTRKQDDPRNGLLQHFGRLVGELKPKYFVVENVKGILSGYACRAVDDFIQKVKKSGYEIVTPIKYLNAQEFGVPQKRQRVFILGYQKGLIPPSYPEPLYGEKTNRSLITVWDAIKDLPNVDDHNYLLATDKYRGKLGTPSDYGKIMRGELPDPHNKKHRTQEKTMILTGNLRSEHNAKSRSRFAKTKPGKVEKISRFFKLDKTGLANTIRAGSSRQYGGYTAPRPIHPVHPRCITVREAARLHSFPDWFTFHPTKWHGFRQVGNAVPPRLANAVADRVYTAIISSNIKKNNRGEKHV